LVGKVEAKQNQAKPIFIIKFSEENFNWKLCNSERPDFAFRRSGFWAHKIR